MRDNVLWRKQSRIIILLAKTLQISEERALDLFYSTNVYKQLSDPKYGLQLMSDEYILEDIINELRKEQRKTSKALSYIITDIPPLTHKIVNFL